MNILWLGENGADDPTVVGGKAAALSRLTKLGFNVPRGFVLPVSVFEAFLPQPLISVIAGLEEAEEETQVSRSLDEIRSAIDAAEWPAHIRESISDAYLELSGLVAVRSSGTIEDGDQSAFAGAFSSFLNRMGEEEVLGAVKECWKSAFTSRVAAYRAQHRLWSSAWSMGVIVQEMVMADQAGVMFTHNPFSGDGTMVIEAVRGGCEQIVGGAPAEMSLRVDRETRRVLEVEELSPPARFGMGATGLLRSPVALRPKLLRKWAIEELVEVGFRLESEFARPQDVEWAIANGKLLLLQSRPLTALHQTKEGT